MMPRHFYLRQLIFAALLALLFAMTYNIASATFEYRSWKWIGSVAYIIDHTENFSSKIGETISDYNTYTNDTTITLTPLSTSDPFISCYQTPGTGTVKYSEVNILVKNNWWGAALVYHAGSEYCTGGVSCTSGYPDFRDNGTCNTTDLRGNIAWIDINGYLLRRQIAAHQRSTTKHEMGHVLGLGHEEGNPIALGFGLPCDPSIMFDRDCTILQIRNNLPIIDTLQSGDIDKLAELYP